MGVESAHKTEEAAESAGRLVRAGYRSQKLRPYRKAAAAERKLEKANVNALYQKSLEENPGLSSRPRPSSPAPAPKGTPATAASVLGRAASCPVTGASCSFIQQKYEKRRPAKRQAVLHTLIHIAFSKIVIPVA